MAYSDYTRNFDVLSISSYTGHSSSEDPITPISPTGLGEESYDFCVEDFLNPEAFSTTATETATDTATEPTESYPRFDPNDPLRYFLELGEITPNEYEKWKLVREEPLEHNQPTLAKKRPDYGPGHNSDSDSMSDDGDDDQGPTIEYGSGYSAHADEYNDPFDPWNPTPDTTDDRRYAKIANDGEYMLSRFTQSVEYNHSATGPGNKLNLQISNSFGLKLAWERFAITSSNEKRLQTLQDFWQANALTTYEALQDLRADHARIRGNRLPIISHHPLPPQYHSTPFETLENTFETIGRMCRCIAEDFNTQSVVNYVEEFIVSLYREIEFNALVEAHENSLVKAEMDIQHQQRQPFSSVFSKEDLQGHIDIQLLKAADPTYRAELMTTDEWLATKKQQ